MEFDRRCTVDQLARCHYLYSVTYRPSPCRTVWEQKLQDARRAAVAQGLALPMAAVVLAPSMAALHVETGGGFSVTLTTTLYVYFCIAPL